MWHPPSPEATGPSREAHPLHPQTWPSPLFHIGAPTETMAPVTTRLKILSGPLSLFLQFSLHTLACLPAPQLSFGASLQTISSLVVIPHHTSPPVIFNNPLLRSLSITTTSPRTVADAASHSRWSTWTTVS